MPVYLVNLVNLTHTGLVRGSRWLGHLKVNVNLIAHTNADRGPSATF
jgi:hypothetical protein